MMNQTIRMSKKSCQRSDVIMSNIYEILVKIYTTGNLLFMLKMSRCIMALFVKIQPVSPSAPKLEGLNTGKTAGNFRWGKTQSCSSASELHLINLFL